MFAGSHVAIVTPFRKGKFDERAFGDLIEWQMPSFFPRSAPALAYPSWGFAGSVRPTEGIRIIQRMQNNRENGMVERVELEIQVPPTFPEKYREALIRSAELCAVKKHIDNPPEFDVYTQVVAQGLAVSIDNHSGAITVPAVKVLPFGMTTIPSLTFHVS